MSLKNINNEFEMEFEFLQGFIRITFFLGFFFILLNKGQKENFKLVIIVGKKRVQESTGIVIYDGDESIKKAL